MNKTIAIAGNPNCGKTTLFNELTGGNQVIGNWPGVTVEKKSGIMKGTGGGIEVIDLPGIYSLMAQSEDELVSRDFLLNGNPDLVINIIDALNIERNLYLTVQLIEMRVPVIILLNRIDLARKQNIEIQTGLLEKQLGCKIIELNAKDPRDVEKAKASIIESLGTPKIASAKIEYPDEVEDLISSIIKKITAIQPPPSHDLRWLAVKTIENDRIITGSETLKDGIDLAGVSREIRKIESIHHEEISLIIAHYRFGFIKGISRLIVHHKADKNEISDKIDTVVLNNFLGIPLFMIAMYAVFTFTIRFGGAFIDFFDESSKILITDNLERILTLFSAPLWLHTLLASGLGAGIQSIATFIPVIFCMFFMLSILEDSGYMARAAFIMDKFMQKIGLPGKSFVPMIVGFGCTVPAVLATRTLDSYRDRIITIFLTPLMSCGARLPVYVVFASAFFPHYTGLIVFTLYLAGILIAVLTGLLFRKTVFKGDTSHFVMELPVYSMPRLKHILIHTWNRLKIFITGAGKIIIIGVVLLAFANSAGTDFSFGNENTGKSILSKIARVITPVFEPMGVAKDNWEASIAVFTGIFAKEAVIGTLNSLYSLNNGETPAKEKNRGILGGVAHSFKTIPDNLSAGFFGADNNDENTSLYVNIRSRFRNDPYSAYAYLLFILIYFPCLAAFGVIVREIGSPAAWLLGFYLTAMAWTVSTLFYQISSGHDPVWIAAASALLIMIFTLFKLAGKNKNIQRIGGS
jgi:ferrous iron transport protein B